MCANHETRLDITDLSKFYGRIRGIEHIDLRIEEGEIFGFLGPNGSGKTNTTRILLNLRFPTSVIYKRKDSYI